MADAYRLQTTHDGRPKSKKIDIDRNGFLFCSSSHSPSSSSRSSRSSSSSSSSHPTRRPRSGMWAVNTAAAVGVSVPVPVTPEGCLSPPSLQRRFFRTPTCSSGSSSGSSDSADSSNSNSSTSTSTSTSSKPSDESSASAGSTTLPRTTTVRQPARSMSLKQYHYHRKHQQHFKAAETTTTTGSTNRNKSYKNATTAVASINSNNKGSCWTSIRALLEATKRTITAADALTAEPFLATQKGLFLALKHRAPASVIGFILNINPHVMDIASSGPTPLQVALHSDAALDVVTLLLEASPFGLCITNSDCPEDPLSYAQRAYGRGSNEKGDKDPRYRPGLIELLSRPLSYWVTERNEKRRSLQTQQNQIRQRQEERQRRYRLQQPDTNAPARKATPLLSPPPPYPLCRSRTPSACRRIEYNGENSSSCAPSTAPSPPVASTAAAATTTTFQQPSLPLPKHNNVFADDATAVLQNTAVFPQHEDQQQHQHHQHHLQMLHQRPQQQHKHHHHQQQQHKHYHHQHHHQQHVQQNQQQDQQQHRHQHQQKSLPTVGISSNDRDTATIDREEINNVKTLCSQLFRAHKRLAQQMIAARANIDAQSELLSTIGTKEEILEELSQQQRSQFVRNLIALDMKETAYKGHLDRLEHRYVLQLEQRLDRCVSGLRLWNETTREGVLDLQAVVEGEAATNAAFRAYVSDWIERRSCAVPSDANASQKVPLCSSAFRREGRVFRRSDASGMMEEFSDAMTDSNKCNNEIDSRTRCDQLVGSDNGATHNENGEGFLDHGHQPYRSRTCTTISPSWKQQLKPCFKNWDRIPLADSS